MPTVLGIPMHPLVVHAVVVLVPLSALGVVTTALSPGLRARFGSLVWLLATGALVAAPVATRSGSELETALYSGSIPARVVAHARIGADVPWFVLAMWGAMTALLLLDREHQRRLGVGSALLPTVVAVVAVLASLVAAGQVVRAGWSGAQAYWSGVPVAAESDMSPASVVGPPTKRC